MRHVLSFSGPKVGLTDPYRYQVMEIPTQGRVQLWYQAPGMKWEIGHSKPIPDGMTAHEVALFMKSFVLGDLDHSDYNVVVPS